MHRVANDKAQRMIAWELAQLIKLMACGWVGWLLELRALYMARGNGARRHWLRKGLLALADGTGESSTFTFPQLLGVSGFAISHMSRNQKKDLLT